MEFPWSFFVVFVCLSGALFVALGTGAWLNRGNLLRLKGSITSIATLGIGIFAGAQYLGYPERIFGALGNPHSVLNRELVAVLVVFMVVHLYKTVHRESNFMSLRRAL